MKDSSQTLLFLGAAILSVFVAMYSRPADATFEVDQLIGQTLFVPPEPDEATAMRIVSYDEGSATLREFEVAEEDGVWSLPSKGGYPADATEQMASASAGVADLEVLGIASQSAGDHAEYGVVEPSSDLEPGQTGVGKRVVLESADGKSLVDVVIGKQVKGEEDQHYVRKTSQDPVYLVRISPSDFSTSFEDWIEQDLLDLEAWDIARVSVKDYSSQLTPQLTSRGIQEVLTIDPRAQITVAFEESDNAWRPIELLEYDRNVSDYKPFELDPQQTLNDDALGELKTAVGDLEIVDVERKPAGLSAELKAGSSLFEDEAAYRSLKNRGFAATGGDGGAEILSTEGEVAISLKDGVEYLLRFGNLQLDTSEEQTEAAEGEADDQQQAESGVNRYLFVVARFNEDLVEKPELEELPAEPTENTEGDSEEATNNAADGEAEEAATTDEDAQEQDSDDASSDSREEIEQRNQRAMDEYNQKVSVAKQRVAELNQRFGDWYYVIADDVYKKIALGRDELIVAKQSEDDEDPAPEGPAGPLGGTGNSVPGLPTLPGVEFNPGAAPEAAPAAEASAAAPDAEAEPNEEDDATESNATANNAAEEAAATDSTTDSPSTEPTTEAATTESPSDPPSDE